MHSRNIYTVLTRISLVILTLVFCTESINAQKVESVYLSEMETGDSIYIVTNREQDKSSKILSFNKKIQSDSQLVFLKVTFHEPDSIVNQILDYTEFKSQVTSIHSDWLLFVHGDSKTYEQSVMRGFDIQHLYQVKVIVFSWPSKDPTINGLKNYKKSKENVKKSMHHFNKLMQYLDSMKQHHKTFKEKTNFSLFVHSLGNSYLEYLFKYSTKENNFGLMFDNVIINSAAVNQEKHKEWVEKMNFQKRIYITSNRQDFNLKGSRIFTSDGKLLGEKVETPIANNANYVQFTKAVGFRFPTGTTHTFFIGEVPEESKNIRNFYYTILHGVEIDLSNEHQFIKREDGVGYNIIF